MGGTATVTGGGGKHVDKEWRVGAEATTARHASGPGSLGSPPPNLGWGHVTNSLNFSRCVSVPTQGWALPSPRNTSPCRIRLMRTGLVERIKHRHDLLASCQPDRKGSQK